MPNGRFFGLGRSKRSASPSAREEAREERDEERDEVPSPVDSSGRSGQAHARDDPGVHTAPSRGQVAYTTLPSTDEEQPSPRGNPGDYRPSPRGFLQDPATTPAAKRDVSRDLSSVSNDSAKTDGSKRSGNSAAQALLPKGPAGALAARSAAAEKAEQDAASAAWRRFFCCLACGLVAAFAASTGASMAATIYLAAPAATTTTTTTTALAATTPVPQLAARLPVETTTSSTTTATRTTTTSTPTSTTATRTTTSSTSSTSTSTTSTTTTRTHTGVGYLPSLFCFTSSQDSGDELELLRIQLAQRRGIFDCNDWAVFSFNEVWLSPGQYKTIAVSGPPSKSVPVPGHPQWKTLLNSAYFMRIWDVIRDKGLARRTEWTVKADPDAMFFPIRMRQYIKYHHLASSSKLYVLNCEPRHALLGSLEVLSRPAAEAFAEGRERCMQHLDWEHEPEDQFTQQCLSFLHVRDIPGWSLVHDARCGGMPSIPCVGEHIVAYHPFRDTASQFACLEALKGSNGISLQSLTV